MASIAKVFDQARAVVEKTGARSSRSAPTVATRAEIDRALTAFVREYIRADAWEVIVPGEHTGGITHQGLFAVLASQGRDFFQSTVQLFQAVKTALQREFFDGGRVPTVAQMKAAIEVPLLDFIELRMSKRGNADVSMEPLSAGYAALKRKRGQGAQPIGVASGELRRAYSRNAKIRWKR